MIKQMLNIEHLKKYPLSVSFPKGLDEVSIERPLINAKAGLLIMEIWKDIPEYEGLYQASNLGRIKSLTRYVNRGRNTKRIVKERILKQLKGTNGYLTVTLSKAGFKKQLLVHRLIGLTFIPNPENKPCVNHKMGIKTDNRSNKLAWCTYSENERHSWDKLGKKPSSGCFKKGTRSHNTQYIAQYDMNGNLLNVFESATAAAYFIDGSQGRISTNCRNESKYCYGYKYNYCSTEFYMLRRYNRIILLSKFQRKKYANKTGQIGEKHHQSKLTMKIIKEVKELYATGNYTQQFLADKYSVCISTLNQAINGKSWKHI